QKSGQGGGPQTVQIVRQGGPTLYWFKFNSLYVLAHRSKPDIIRLSTSVKIVLFSQLTLNFGVEK
ncbi:TPA: hypothetical protein ACKN01_002243, partial [Neisseria gonorrhoeae]